MKISLFLAVLYLFLFLSQNVFMQNQRTMQPSQILDEIKGLKSFGRVLYIAAHPDDENTAVLAYCSNKLHMTAAYLSLTRGDGGQNIIGNEQSTDLGIIRTQELLAARRIDGARQFFTRAYDFGYSKSPEETLRKWNKEELLKDVVYAIRKFQPDVIITRFPATGEGGHGHHTSSAIIAEEAFELAARRDVYTEQFSEVGIWAAQRLVWNAWAPVLKNRGINPDTLLQLDIGEYSAVLGMSYNEMAALSRSMHKSQGFGSTPQRGEQKQYFLHIKGTPAKKDVFEGSALLLNSNYIFKRFTSLVDSIISGFDINNPSASVPGLIKAYHILESETMNQTAREKCEKIKELILSCSGVWLESVSDREVYTFGDTMKVKTSVINRLGIPLKVISFNNNSVNAIPENNIPYSYHYVQTIDKKERISNPFWIDQKKENDMFTINNLSMRNTADNKEWFVTEIGLDFGLNKMSFTVPVQYRKNDPVYGEQLLTPVVTPPVSLYFDAPLYISNGAYGKQITVRVKANKNVASGRIKPVLPAGWLSTPVDYFVDNIAAGESAEYIFNIASGNNESMGEISADFSVDGAVYNKTMYVIQYPHIPKQTIQIPVSAKMLVMELKHKKKNIGYLEGAGDKVRESLEAAGYKTAVLNENDVLGGDISGYQTIITGVRFFNTREKSRAVLEKLLHYIQNGGNLIVQYNTAGELKVAYPGPYSFTLSRDRVTEEDAEVTITDPASPLLNNPYKINRNDFTGWVQERGLYFPANVSEKYKTLFTMNDKNESAKSSSIIYSRYGKGIFIYTGISFFRQLPAGVPGAFRLMINLIEQE